MGTARRAILGLPPGRRGPAGAREGTLHGIATSTLTPSLDARAHRALVARVLRIDPAAWDEILAQFRDGAPADAPPASRLQRLAAIVAARFPSAPAFDGAALTRPCPACGAASVRTRYRRAGDGDTALPVAYATCPACGHAVLVDDAPPEDPYASAAYYERQDAAGVGYAGYERERAFREARGERLLRWALARRTATGTSLLEVGSAFGFTRRAAERLGLRTAGVDRNPFAAHRARALYGLDTIVGTLQDAHARGALAPGGYDLVLYDFVLEHVEDPQAELRLAAGALAPAGTLVLRVPGMEALEVGPFGALYRSFRRDHLHVFTRASLAHLLAGAGLALTALETGCGADLLREVVPRRTRRAAYAAGFGPDITCCATPIAHAHPARHRA